MARFRFNTQRDNWRYAPCIPAAQADGDSPRSPDRFDDEIANPAAPQHTRTPRLTSPLIETIAHGER